MEITTLYEQDFTLYQSCHQSHMTCEFYVPKGTDHLSIHFHYAPLLEADYQTLVFPFIREGLALDLLKEGDGYRNLLTLSVNDPTGFRGAHHYFNTNQVIEIGPDTTSLGFLKGEVQTGNWQVILSCHGLFSEEVKGSLLVEGHSSNPIDYHRPLPLSGHIIQERHLDRPQSNLQSHYVKAELHAHTLHSDARQSTQELLDAAAEREIDWLALTDHNTITAIQEAQLADLYHHPLHLIPGLEFTTFYGHFLIHGAPEYLFKNWTGVNLSNVHQYLSQIKTQPINVTIAHPFDEGNPYCTGCRWDYFLEDLQSVDAIEIWNSPNPHLSASNQLAYLKWLQLLEQGFEIAATAGRDWHGPASEEERIAETFFLVPQNEELVDILESHRLGRSYMTLGPRLINFTLDKTYQLGDRLPIHKSTYQLDLALEGLTPGDRLYLMDAHQIIKEFTAEDQAYTFQGEIDLADYQFMRLEIRDQNQSLITVTNPIYR